MKKLINSTILPVSFCAFFWGVYYILRCFDVPVWLYRGISSLIVSVLLTLIVSLIWLLVSDQIDSVEDDDPGDFLKDKDIEDEPYKGKVYGSDESQDE